MGTEQPGHSGWGFTSNPFAITWGVSTPYLITGWSFEYPYGASLTVNFTF
jgi:hypothetical protein